MKLVDFTDRVAIILQDAVKKLADADRSALTLQAICQRYSKDRPREIVTDVAGKGTSDLALPQDAGGALFEEGFSLIRQLEFPIGQVPPATIEESDWQWYRTPDGLKIRLLGETPGANEKVRVTWTARHAADGSTVPANDFEAVCDLASALCFEALAAAYAQTGDNSMGADVVNYRTKGQEYLALAKAARKRYLDYMGIEDGATGASGGNNGPALAMGDMDNMMEWGGDRMTHRRPR
jgi:hypothetical protein